MNLKNKKIIVVGLASSGIAAAEFLSTQGAQVTCIDKNKSIKRTNEINNLLELGVKFKTGEHTLKDFHKAQLVILSPGVPHTLPPIKAVAKLGVPVIGEIELASNFINKPIIGITGTNGKTTTAKLIEKMLINSSKKVFLGGNTGTPLTKCLYNMNNIDVVIVELSSFQLDTIKNFRPTTSVLLNIAEDHMDRYTSFNNYAKSKLKIFTNQTKKHIAIFNVIDNLSRKLVRSQDLQSQQRPFSKLPIENGAQIFEKFILVFDKKKQLYKLDLTKTKLKGSHNRENIAAASIASLAEGGNKKGIQSAIDNFLTPKHRIETVGYSRGIRFVNDSKATNVHATISALKSFDTPVLLILGGQSKNINFRLLRPHITKQVKAIIAIGEARNDIKLALLHTTFQTNIIKTITLENAIEKSIKLAKTGDTILLSPACSSFDQFKNYKHRGEKFKKLVNKLN